MTLNSCLFERGILAESNKATLAIVGGGPAGVAIIVYLSLYAERLKQTRILLFERQKTIGSGTPHGDSSDCLLVNMVLHAHTVHPFDQCHFINWLRLKYSWVSDAPVPRKWVGQYLADSYTEAVKQLRMFDVEVETVLKEVISIDQEEADGLLTICTADGLSFSVTYVVLALGHQQPKIPAGFSSGEITYV